MKKIILLFVIFSTIGIFAQSKTAGYYPYYTECLSSEMDGSQIVKGWGSGKNKREALEQAKKNALRDVLFKGIRNGKENCDQKPLLTEVNADEKYKDYFSVFFADEGEYLKFVSSDDKPIKSDKKKSSEGVTCGLVIRVLRPQLRERLIQDIIIKK